MNSEIVLVVGDCFVPQRICDINEQFKDVRIGAFEVQLCLKTDNQTKVFVLHSKLQIK